MNDDWQWFLGLLASMAAAFITTMVVAFRHVYTKISKGDGELHKRIEASRMTMCARDHLQTQFDHFGRRLDDMREQSERRHAELKELVKDAFRDR